jgi:hypothetical protein
MPTGAKRLEIDVLGLPQHQASAPVSGGHQLQLIAGVVCPPFVRLIQETAANGTAVRCMGLLSIHR